jgi:hypothetical protein
MDTIRLIDVPAVTDGRVLQILMNAELGEAIGLLAQPKSSPETGEKRSKYAEIQSDNYWPWRLRMAEYLASRLDGEKFGVKALYLFGSTKTATAGPASDIDILVHFDGTPEQERMLNSWLEAWSICLDQMNYLQTGYKSGGLLDFHLLTDDDFARRTSYAVKVGAVTDAARQLPLMKKKSETPEQSE